MEYIKTTYGERARVHREYVDVVARFGRDGSIEPVAVMWRDGRSFPVDEVTGKGEFGSPEHGRCTARYDVRFGGHETSMYLERREASPTLAEPERLRWWVWARDQVKSGTARTEGDRR